MSDKDKDKADESSGVIEPSILEGVKVETLRRVLIRVLGTEIQELRNQEVKLVKIQWGEALEDATWEI